MFDPFYITRLIEFSSEAHATQITHWRKAFRKFDGRTPYSVHLIWCAMTILAEPLLDKQLRWKGMQVLLLHDILEDTTSNPPRWTHHSIRESVEEMSFAGGFAEEVEQIWNRDDECKLFKLYDKVHNLMDGSWMSAEKRQQYAAHTLQLANSVEQTYGTLNIVKISRAICT